MGIEPKGQSLRRAVRWLSDNGDYSYQAVEAAARRFDLSPLDEEFLLRVFVHADARPGGAASETIENGG